MGKVKVATRKGKVIKITVILLVVAALAVAGVYFVKKFFFSSDTGDTITPYSVEKGDISVTISGTGTVEPIEQYEISSVVKGDVIADYITVGDQVNAGDLLYQVDSSEAQNSIEKSRIALQKQQLSYSETVSNIENLTVTASINGTITNMYVQNGDNISNNGKVCDIVNSVTMSLKIPFLADDAKNMAAGQAATVVLEATNEALSGKVKRITSGTYATANGAVVSDVEIIFHNPGAVKPGDTATATVGGMACNQAAEINYGDQITVLAKTSGEVSGLTLSVGDTVTAGTTLCRLTNASSSINAQSSELSIRDAQLALQNQIDQLEDYNIKSPIAGTVIEKTYKAGDTLDGNKSSLAVVADMSQLTFTMNIDELDIKSISEGQEVIVTADALPDQTFTGIIDNISIIGASGNGVTTYPVKVIVSEYEGLLPGMNVNAEIISEQVTDVLKIPVAALSRGNLVLVTQEYADSIGAVKAEGRQGGGFGKRDGASSENKTAPDGGAGTPPDSADGAAQNSDAPTPPSGMPGSGDEYSGAGAPTERRPPFIRYCSRPRGEFRLLSGCPCSRFGYYPNR